LRRVVGLIVAGLGLAGNHEIRKIPREGRPTTTVANSTILRGGAGRAASIAFPSIPFEHDTQVGGFPLQVVKARQRAAADDE
jgi:hypothetical protein